MPAVNFWRTAFRKNGIIWKDPQMIDDGERVIKMITES